jgi:hypothetical protein
MPGSSPWKCLKRLQNEDSLRPVVIWRCIQRPGPRLSVATPNHLHNFQTCSPDTLLENEVVFAICSTHIGGAPPPSAAPFFKALFDQSASFSLKDVRFAVLGLGHSEYAENYCKVCRPLSLPSLAALSVSHTSQAPKELDAQLEALGGQRLAPIFLDDFGLFKEVFLVPSCSLFIFVYFPMFLQMEFVDEASGIQPMETNSVGQRRDVFWYGGVWSWGRQRRKQR